MGAAGLGLLSGGGLGALGGARGGGALTWFCGLAGFGASAFFTSSFITTASTTLAFAGGGAGALPTLDGAGLISG